MRSILIIIFFPITIFAHGSKTKTVDESVTLSLTKFEADQSETVVNAFSAVKAWVSGAKVRVKIYYQMHQNHILYTCESVHVNNQDILQCSQD